MDGRIITCWMLSLRWIVSALSVDIKDGKDRIRVRHISARQSLCCVTSKHVVVIFTKLSQYTVVISELCRSVWVMLCFVFTRGGLINSYYNCNGF